MEEAMVLVRTFPTEVEAGVAQEELRASGIQSLLFSDGGAPATDASGRRVHLAVHQRDETIAEAVLKAVMSAE